MLPAADASSVDDSGTPAWWEPEFFGIIVVVRTQFCALHGEVEYCPRELSLGLLLPLLDEFFRRGWRILDIVSLTYGVNALDDCLFPILARLLAVLFGLQLCLCLGFRPLFLNGGLADVLNHQGSDDIGYGHAACLG